MILPSECIAWVLHEALQRVANVQFRSKEVEARLLEDNNLVS